MELIKYVLGGFWRFCGFAFLLALSLNGLSEVIKQLKK